jgi:hypothetical protein
VAINGGKKKRKKKNLAITIGGYHNFLQFRKKILKI